MHSGKEQCHFLDNFFCESCDCGQKQPFLLPRQRWEERETPKTSKCWRYLLRKSPTDVEAFISAGRLHCSLRSHCAPAPMEPGAFAGGLLGAVKRHRPLERECWMKWWEMMGCSSSERFLKPCEMGLTDKMSCFPNLSDCSSSCDKWSVRITGDTNASTYDTCKCRQHNTDTFTFTLPFFYWSKEGIYCKTWLLFLILICPKGALFTPARLSSWSKDSHLFISRGLKNASSFSAVTLFPLCRLNRVR